MLQSLGKYSSAEFLRDQVQTIILECFGDPADHGNRNRRKQKPDHTIIMIHHLCFCYHSLPVHLYINIVELIIYKKELGPIKCFYIFVIVCQVYQLSQKDGIEQRKTNINSGK